MLNSIVAYACKSSKPMDSDTENLFYVFKIISRLVLGFPCGSAGKRICLQWERPGFNPRVGKIPWRRERLPTPVFWPGEFQGLYSPWGHIELDRTERLSLSLGLSYCYFHNVIWQEELCKAKAKTLMSSFISLDNHLAIIIPTDFTTWIKCCISVAYNVGHLFNV